MSITSLSFLYRFRLRFPTPFKGIYGIFYKAEREISNLVNYNFT